VASLDEALAFACETGERFQESELLRLRGELALTGRKSVERRNGEAHLVRAVAIARAQAASLLELRALLALARLGSAGRRREALARIGELRPGLRARSGGAELNQANRLLGRGVATASTVRPRR